MFRLIRALIVFFLVVLPVLAIAVANRHKVNLVLDPFMPDSPSMSVSLPLFVYLFTALITGLLIGGTATWISQAKWRRSAKKQTADANRWRREADQLKRQIENAAQPQLTHSASGK